jgi:PKD repeat protein
VDNFSWSFEGGSPEQSSEENPLVTYTEPGTYDVKLVVSGEGYSDTLIKPDYIKVEFCSSINEITQRTMVYPNPAHTCLNIQYYPAKKGDLSLKLINLYGRVVWKKQVGDVNNLLNENLDVEGLQKGIYFLVIEEKSYRSTKKILVN